MRTVHSAAAVSFLNMLSPSFGGPDGSSVVVDSGSRPSGIPHLEQRFQTVLQGAQSPEVLQTSRAQGDSSGPLLQSDRLLAFALSVGVLSWHFI